MNRVAAAARGAWVAAALCLGACVDPYKLPEHRAWRAREEERAALVQQLADPAVSGPAGRTIASRGPVMIPYLLHAALSENPALQVPAIGLLGEIRPPEARLPLQEVVSKSLLPGVRIAAAEALARLGDPEAVPALAAALAADPSPLARRAIVRTLALLGDPRGFAAVARALRDESDAVRFEACDALSRLGGDRAAEALLRRYRELPVGGSGLAPAPAPAVAAGGVSAALVAAGPGYDLPGDYAEHRAVLLALGGTRSSLALDPLRQELLEAPAARVRRSAAESLRRFGDPRTIRALIQALLDVDEGVFEAALDALETLAGERYEDGSVNPFERRHRTFELWLKWAMGEDVVPQDR